MTGPSLTSPFKNTQQLQKAGKSFTYIPVEEVINRLNTVLGLGKWSFTCREVRVNEDKSVVVHGRLETLGGVWEQFGGQTNLSDSGDTFKGAASDALKKCCQSIGIGLYIALERPPDFLGLEIGGASAPLNAEPTPAAPSSTASNRTDDDTRVAAPISDATGNGAGAVVDAAVSVPVADNAIESMQAGHLKKQIAALRDDDARAFISFRKHNGLPLNADDFSDEQREIAASFFDTVKL